jgi:N-acetylglucosaminyldiphosphoundecaprenol N-acetyl-beta-D-mannosaminyltransferase
MRQRVRILNCAFDPLPRCEAVDAVFQALSAGTRGWLCTANVAALIMMRKDRRLQSFIEQALLVVADGQPIVWCAPLFGPRLPERVTGIDLIDSLCARAEVEGKGVYLLGTTKPLLRKAIAVLRTRYPRLQIDGADGYFSMDSDSSCRANQIRASGAELLFVGMGSPRQEIFISENWNELGVGLAIGVGGSFDVIAGARSRAPRWVRHIGLEWLVRLVQEPRRLLWRYAATNSKFCLLIANVIVKRLLRRSVVH